VAFLLNMANSKRDENRVPTLIGVSSVDLATPTLGAINPVTNALLVQASIDTTGLATSTIQTDGSQKTQLVDAGGEAATITGGKLDVNASIDTTGLATSAKQLADGHNVTVDNSTGAAAVNVQDGGNTLTVDGTVAVTNTGLTALNGAINSSKVDVNIASGNPTTITATQSTASNLKVEATIAATQTLATLTTITNDVGIKDNGNTITVDGTVSVNAHAVTVASGGIASGAIASGAVASGAIASGAIASGALAAGSIAVGAITAGDTSIATTEDTARAGAEHLVKIGVSRLDTPVANANVTTDGDYTNITADNFGKVWVAGAIPEDTAHISGEALSVQGSRRILTLATSSGSDADWSTVNQSAEGAAWATLAPTTTSGLSVGNFTSGDSFTALTATSQVVKGSAGLFYGYYIYNPNAAATYVMIYNVASASVTVGTTNPLLVFCIPATSAANLALPYGITFDTAMAIAAATTGGGNSAPSTALEAMIFFK
jgi:hypothetical protein